MGMRWGSLYKSGGVNNTLMMKVGLMNGRISGEGRARERMLRL